MYYYKDNNNNYYALKTALWRSEEERTHKDDNDEDVVDELTEQEQENINKYQVITETAFNEHLEEIKPIAPNQNEIEMAQIKQWLNDHDYIINKHLLGEYADDDERWTSYLQERAVKLARFNELEND